MNKKIAIIGAVDLGRTTANMIEVNKGVEVNPAFAPEPMMITNFYENLKEPFVKGQFKKFRKHNNRKHSKRRK